VWIVDTPLNRAETQERWSADPTRSHWEGVTIFKAPDHCPSEDILIGQLDTIDLHHGSYSTHPPYTVIEVIGTAISEKLKSKLSHYGFNQFEAMPQGFSAVRPLPHNCSLIAKNCRLRCA